MQLRRGLLLPLVAVVHCLLLQLQRITAESDPILYCGACIALIEEIDWQTEIVSPKLKIQIGNFHLDDKGNMLNTKQIPLARSEVHIVEVMETVCRYMYLYILYHDSRGRSNYIRTMSRDGSTISKRHTEDLQQDKKQTLEFACDTILEANDDELTKLYQSATPDITEKLCVDITGLCSKENVTDHMWAYASAVMLGMSEKAAILGDPHAMETIAKIEREEAALQARQDGVDVDEQDQDEEEEVGDISIDDDGDDDEGVKPSGTSDQNETGATLGRSEL